MANILKYNGITYVRRGTVEDNGQYDHYYYTTNIEKTYNIIYEGQKGTLTTDTLYYINEETDQIITRDYFSWSMHYGYTVQAGTCLSAAQEAEIQNIIDTCSYEPDTLIDSSTGDKGNNGDLEGGIGEKSPPDSSLDNNDKDKGDSSKGLFDDTMGVDDENYVRSTLPLGADLHNIDLVGADIKDIDPEHIGESNLYNKGTTYPIIRINDHYFTQDEIQEFSMECGYYKDYTDYAKYKMPITGFLPTMRLIVRTANPDLLKTNHIKQGDRCAVFFSASHQMIKSMRCDFRITSCVSDDMTQNRYDAFVTYIIKGELYIPDLRNEELRYNFNGSSRDAMMDIAKRLRLAFFFCDPEDTAEDVMVWCNCKTPELFIHDLTTHAWKNADSFFESWIDPRYGLSFQNINHLLGESGLDETIDATLWINAFVNHRNYISETEREKLDRAQAKILTNINADPESATVFHINSWKYINKAQEIQDFIGLNCKMQYESINPGLQDSSTAANYSVEYSMCLNKDKFDPTKTDNNFYVLLGPARNLTYAQSDTNMQVSETESSNKQDPEQIVNQQSDGDAETILATDGNMMSSGNTHKFYETAYEHNMRNLLQLQKQEIVVELNGANISIVRGEKIPVLLADIDKAISLLYSNNYSAYNQIGDVSSGALVNRETLSNIIYEAESGWYIIDGIEWVYDPRSPNTMGTFWRTNVKLTRREWPIPNKTLLDANLQTENYQQQLYLINTNAGSVKLSKEDAYRYGYTDEDLLYPLPPHEPVKGVGTYEDGTTLLAETVVTAQGGKRKVPGSDIVDPIAGLTGVNIPGLTDTNQAGTMYDGNGATTSNIVNWATDLYNQYVTNEDKVENSTVPLTGLKDYMKQIYRAIAEASDNRIRLVSARRWAADEYGNKIDGNAFVTKNGYYKCMNAMGDVLYFKKNNSRHLYGEAIDIINNNIDFMELMTDVIMKNPEVLKLMYTYGVSAYIEQAKDDTGVTTKHYHIGTDTIKQAEFWASVRAILGNDRIPGTVITFSNYMKNNTHAELEISHIEVDEKSLEDQIS